MHDMLRTAYTQYYPALYRGTVEKNEDPKNLGRCKVRVPSIFGDGLPTDSLPWSRPMVLNPVKSSKGSVNIPDVGDIVWVLFEGANKEHPIYFGGTYAPEELDISLDIVDFYIENDTRITYHRKNREYEIILKDIRIRVNEEDILLHGDTYIEGNLYVTGNVSIVGDVSVVGDTSLDGDVTIEEDLEVKGHTTLKTLTVRDTAYIPLLNINDTTGEDSEVEESE